MLREAFLDGMSRAACTVSVVTTAGAAGRGGVTVSAMTSVSADGAAPSLLVCVNQQSAAAGMILQNGVFCVNVLRDDQAHISDTFAGRTKNPSGDRFEGVSWRALKSGAPVLDEALVAFDCRLGAASAPRNAPCPCRRARRHRAQRAELAADLCQSCLWPPGAAGRAASCRDETCGPAGTIAPDRLPGRAGPLRHGRAVGCLRRDAASDSMSSWSRTTKSPLIEGVRRGELSLALTYDLDLGADLEIEVLGELQPYALLPAAHPLAQRPSVSLADLAPEPMVLLDLPGTREHQRGHFAASGLHP